MYLWTLSLYNVLDDVLRSKNILLSRQIQWRILRPIYKGFFLIEDMCIMYYQGVFMDFVIPLHNVLDDALNFLILNSNRHVRSSRTIP